MPNPHGAARDDDFTALRLELAVPAGIAGFGNYLVWMVATRAAELVDAVYDSGVARPSPNYRMLDGHHLPTQSLFAWFILATRRGTDPARMPRDDEVLHKAQRILRATPGTLRRGPPSGTPSTRRRSAASPGRCSPGR
jgi:hypothetical protein